MLLVITKRFIELHLPVHDLKPKLIFHLKGYMTFTFDLVTLTLGQFQRPININTLCKYYQDPSIRSWFITERIFDINVNVTLTFDLVTLTLGQLWRLININYINKYLQDPSIRSWFISKKHLMRRASRPGKAVHLCNKSGKVLWPYA